jgi:hypothetical protein
MRKCLVTGQNCRKIKLSYILSRHKTKFFGFVFVDFPGIYREPMGFAEVATGTKSADLKGNSNKKGGGIWRESLTVRVKT